MVQVVKAVDNEVATDLAVVTDNSVFNRMKNHYITQNLKPGLTKPYSLKEVAKVFNVSLGHVRNVSSRFKWNEELRAMMERQSQQATQSIQEVQLVNEIEIRSRQAQYARLAMSKAITKIQSIDPKNLSVKEAIELLKLGLQEERRALGLVESVTYQVPSKDQDNQKLGAVQRAMSIIDQLADRASNAFEG